MRIRKTKLRRGVRERVRTLWGDARKGKGPEDLGRKHLLVSMWARFRAVRWGRLRMPEHTIWRGSDCTGEAYGGWVLDRKCGEYRKEA